MTLPPRSVQAGDPPDAAAPHDPQLSFGDALRSAERRCWLLSHLASGREGVPAPQVWEGLNELLREHASLFAAAVALLPPEVLDERRDA